MPEKEKSNLRFQVTIAAIPVVGSIIIALITTNSFKCNSSETRIDSSLLKEQARISLLRIKAGKVNDNVVYARYSDLFPMLAEGVKPYITEKVFNKERDSIKIDLGDYIKTIDTIYSKAYGADHFYIKNQYQQGTNLITITFDQDEKVIGLLTAHIPDKR